MRHLVLITILGLLVGANNVQADEELSLYCGLSVGGVDVIRARKLPVKRDPNNLRESLPGPQVAKLDDNIVPASFSAPVTRYFNNPFRHRSRLPEAITIAIVGCHWF